MPRRSLRIDGKSTSIHLEDAFWSQIERLSEEQSLSWSEYCRQIIDQVDGETNRSAAIKQRLLEIARASTPGGVASIWRLTRDNVRSEHRFAQSVLTVGRSRSCDIPIDSSKASRVHAALMLVTSQWWVVDLQSHNGTCVNGRAVTRRAIGPDDSIRIAGAKLAVLKTDDVGGRAGR